MANNIFSLNKKPGKGVPLFGKGPTFIGIKPKPFVKSQTLFGSAKNLSKVKKLKRPRDIDIFPVRLPKIKSKRDKDLNWTQASTRYRHLSPFADTDKDGIQNWQDCRPLNIKMQGPLHNSKTYTTTYTPGDKERAEGKKKKAEGKKKKKEDKLEPTWKPVTDLVKREGKRLKEDVKEGAIEKGIFAAPLAATRAKEKARASRRLGVGVLGFLGLISEKEEKSFAPAYRGKGTSKGPRGRPAGSYKYTIPGKGPVHVYEYRKWARRQRALKRLQREPEYEEFEGERIQAPPPRREFEPEPQEQTQERFTEGRGQYEAMQQDRGEMRAGETTVRDSSILSATPIMETDRGKSSILKAVNVFNEEERATLPPMKDPVQNVDTVHKPVVNPEGDYYTDVDPLSGKPILQRRVRERWAEGE